MDKNGRHFTIEQDGATQIIVLPRNLSTLANIDVLEEFDVVIAGLQRDGTKEVVIDFRFISYFGSGALEAMLHLWKQVTAAGGKMALCNVSDIGREILSISRFDTVWPICATRDAALAAVRE